MRTYAFNFWAIPTLVSFQKILSQCDTDVAFSADDSQIAVSEDGRLSSEHVMVWYKLKGDDLDEILGLLQIWKLRDHTECMYPLGINMDTPVPPHVIHRITTLVSSFPLYWPHRNTHLMESSSHVILRRRMMSESVIYGLVNSRQACYNTRRPQNLQHLHWPCVCSVLRPRMAHRDGTKLASDQRNDPIKIYNLIRIYDIADRTAKHRNDTHGYVLILWGTRDGWLMGQDDLSTGKLYV